uniref:ORF66 n=1 Tax=Latid herpesvirus 1 TaxID=3096545 RepID=A0AB33V6X8_9VIRU
MVSQPKVLRTRCREISLSGPYRKVSVSRGDSSPSEKSLSHDMGTSGPSPAAAAAIANALDINSVFTGEVSLAINVSGFNDAIVNERAARAETALNSGRQRARPPPVLPAGGLQPSPAQPAPPQPAPPQPSPAPAPAQPWGARAPPAPHYGGGSVTYNVSMDVNRLLSGIRGARATPTLPNEPAGGGEAEKELKKYRRALATVGTCVKHLFEIFPAAKTLDHPDVKFLLSAAKRDFANAAINEGLRRESMGRTTVIIPGAGSGGGSGRIELNLGLGGEDRLSRVLGKLAQVWEYESKHWEQVIRRARSTLDVQALIRDNELMVEEPFSQTRELLQFVRGSVEDMDEVPGLARDRLGDWLGTAERYLEIDRKLLVQALTEGAVFRSELEKLKQEHAVLVETHMHMRSRGWN